MVIDDILTESESADKWLSNYTLQNLDKWPSESIMQTLIKKYPLDNPTVVYRGMNFDTQEEYEKFIEKFDKTGMATLSFNGISSWSTSITTANQFAITRPSYYIDWSVVNADSKREKEKEYIIGYRGIILKTTAIPNKSINVNKSKHVKENEIILIPGTYQVQIHKQIKKFADVIDNGEENIKSVILKMLDLKTQNKSDEYIQQFYNYMLHRFGDIIRQDEKLKNLIYKISFNWLTKKEKNILDLISISIESNDSLNYRWYGYKSVNISFNWTLFELFNDGFLPKSKIPLIRKYADKIVTAYVKTVEMYSGEEYDYNFGRLMLLREYTSKPYMVEKLLQKQVGALYNRLNSKEFVDKINSIEDATERTKAVKQFKDNILRVLNQVTRN